MLQLAVAVWRFSPSLTRILCSRGAAPCHHATGSKCGMFIGNKGKPILAGSNGCNSHLMVFGGLGWVEISSDKVKTLLSMLFPSQIEPTDSYCITVVLTRPMRPQSSWELCYKVKRWAVWPWEVWKMRKAQWQQRLRSGETTVPSKIGIPRCLADTLWRCGFTGANNYQPWFFRFFGLPLVYGPY